MMFSCVCVNFLNAEFTDAHKKEGHFVFKVNRVATLFLFGGGKARATILSPSPQKL